MREQTTKVVTGGLMNNLNLFNHYDLLSCADPEGHRRSEPPENHKTIGFLNNTAPDSL